MAVEDLTRALPKTREIVITVKGRRSGREISDPVWFVQEGNTLYLLPVDGSNSNWYRNILETPALRVAVDGSEATLDAKPITDPAKVAEVVEKFREKYGPDQVEQYYPKPEVAVEVPLG
jgi:hypothetical protein